MRRMKAVGRIGAMLTMAVLASGLAAGCKAIDAKRGYMVEEVLLQSIQPGIDDKKSVERTLGRPTFTSEYGDESWYYVSSTTRQKAFKTPKIREHEIYTVNFDKTGNVLSTERSGMEQVVKLSPEGDKTPTLGKDRTFLQDLFGNIGAVGAGGGSPGGGGAGS